MKRDRNRQQKLQKKTSQNLFNKQQNKSVVAGKQIKLISATGKNFTKKLNAPTKSTPYGKHVVRNNTYHYDGKGNPYWSHHRIGTPANHWHTSFGSDGKHITNYFLFLLALIFGK